MRGFFFYGSTFYTKRLADAAIGDFLQELVSDLLLVDSRPTNLGILSGIVLNGSKLNSTDLPRGRLYPLDASLPNLFWTFEYLADGGRCDESRAMLLLEA